MRKRDVVVVGAALALLAVFAVGMVSAQERGGGFSPEQMRQRTMDRIKEALVPTDEEWTALEPKISKVVELYTASMMRMGRRRSESAPADESEIGQAAAALDSTLSNKEAAPEEIKAKLETLRAARAKAKADLAAAQKELAAAVTPAQEARLVLLGYLE